MYEYNYFTIYSSTSTITLECNHDYFHDYFNEYPVSNIKTTFMESLCVYVSCHFSQASIWHQFILVSWLTLKLSLPHNIVAMIK